MQAYLNQHLNYRRITYIGLGMTDDPREWGLTYGVGDVVPQLLSLWCMNHTAPTCPGCGIVASKGYTATSVTYGMARGNVLFYTSDLPNAGQSALNQPRECYLNSGLTPASPVSSLTDSWISQQNILNPFHITVNMMAAHLCSYACYFSKFTNDPEDRCFFTTDPGYHRYPCNVSAVIAVKNRFPFTRQGKAQQQQQKYLRTP